MQVKQRVLYYGDAIQWYFNDKWHRDGDLPARCFFSDGKLDIVHYYQYDELHCATGPAIVAYCSKKKWYYYQDRCYGSLEEMLMVEACK